MPIEIPYVNTTSSDTALEFESRFARLPHSAGVIFASVAPEPALDGVSTTFIVFLGLSRKLSEATGLALIRSILGTELAERKITFKFSVFCGTSGAYRDSDIARVGTLPS